MNFDSRGIPGVSVVTTGFTDAVTVQSRAFVAHPIQDRTDEEMRALADMAIEEILSCLTKP